MISKSERHYLAPLDFHTSDKAFCCCLPGSLESTPQKKISYTSEDVWIGVKRKTGFSFKKMLTPVSLMQLYFTIYCRCALETLLEYNWKRNSLRVWLQFLTLPCGKPFEANLPSNVIRWGRFWWMLFASFGMPLAARRKHKMTKCANKGWRDTFSVSFFSRDFPLSWRGSAPLSWWLSVNTIRVFDLAIWSLSSS